MRSTRSAAERTAYCGVFLALAFGLSYLEMLIPFSFGIPGIKAGFANIAVMVMMYVVGDVEAVIVSVLRVVLTSLLFGNPFSFAFAIAGALSSYIVMRLLKKHLSVITVSITGGVTHNIAQFMVGLFVIKNFNIIFYLPVLIVSGIAAGLLTSVFTKVIIEHEVKKK